MKAAKLLFGAIIAIVLLGLYAFSLLEAIGLALDHLPDAVPKPLPEGATAPPVPQLGVGVSRTLATVGGLVSALVIAVLAISKPGEAPAEGALAAAVAPGAAPPGDTARLVAGIISSIYVLVWIALGVAAYVVGELIAPGVVPALTDFGQAWLGLAVAAGYSYFGLSR